MGISMSSFNFKGIKIKGGNELTLLLTYAMVCVVFTTLSPFFFSAQNFLNIGIYSAITGITATTTTLALIIGCFDISIGGLMALTGMLTAILIRSGVPMGLAILIAFAAGAACGAFNGFLVSKAKVNAMIATISTMSIFRGIAFLLNDGVSIVINDSGFKWIARGYIGPAPLLIIILLAFYFSFWYLSKYSAFGRKIYAIGANKRASYLSGINTDKTIFLVYLLNGMVAGISGILMASQVGAGLPSAGEGYEMTIISACILGGTSLFGGKGSVWGSFVGILMLTTISTGLTMLAVQTFWQQIIKGSILILSVIIDVVRSGGYKKV